MKLLLFLLPGLIFAPAWAYKVVDVVDGDTLTLVVGKEPVVVRLADIDAPERDQAYSDQARQSLAAMCFGKDAQYRERDIDVYGRVVATVTCEGINVSQAQVEKGLAWVYPKYNQDLSLPGLEAMARRDRRGLWAQAKAMPPWEHRRRPRAKNVAARQSVEGICFVGRHGEYRIVDGARHYGC